MMSSSLRIMVIVVNIFLMSFVAAQTVDSSEVEQNKKNQLKQSMQQAFIRSAVFPGWGQYYQGKKISPCIYSLAFLGSIGLSAKYYIDHDDAVKDYKSIREQYLKAFDNERIEVLRIKMHKLFYVSESLKKTRNLLYGLTASVYLLNLIDIFVFPDIMGKKVSVNTNIKQNIIYTGFVLHID